MANIIFISTHLVWLAKKASESAKGTLLIRGLGSNNAIIIENKIKSGINGVRHDLEHDINKTQLKRYIEIIKKENKNKKLGIFLLLPNHHNLASCEKYDGYWVLTYKTLYDFC